MSVETVLPLAADAEMVSASQRFSVATIVPIIIPRLPVIYLESLPIMGIVQKARDRANALVSEDDLSRQLQDSRAGRSGGCTKCGEA